MAYLTLSIAIASFLLLDDPCLEQLSHQHHRSRQEHHFQALPLLLLQIPLQFLHSQNLLLHCDHSAGRY